MLRHTSGPVTTSRATGFSPVDAKAYVTGTASTILVMVSKGNTKDNRIPVNRKKRFSRKKVSLLKNTR
ncbi:hypothetical protein LS482_04840 [Sinomicrobium kalidii]|uniref:hypothetical protein n=1 Tax=Sinomicrobium kalidii TaxID=2900738 RepID=UPI001E3EBC62|nr:hypothetical protein [Sinomicrobium kalidii]UGU18422.1 hypothetical protein LS482_04840 [Sinomicrobium kalidii]